MDLITGKALKAFNEWLFKTHGLYLYNVFNQTLLHAMIIDWLDSVGIYVNVSPYYISHETKYSNGDFKAVINFQDGSETISVDLPLEYDSKRCDRHQATQEAIKKAVYLYNERSEE